MINNNNNNDKDRLQVPEVCKNPIDLGKKNIQDLIEEFDKKLAKTTFMSGCNIPYNSNECILPQQNKFFFSRKNRIFVANIKKDMIAISLKTNISVQSKKPIQKDNSGMLSVQIIISAEDKEEFYVSITEDLIFVFDSEPDDLDDILSTRCYKIALNDISKRLDGIFEIMGYPKLDLVSHISE